jgi:hypothetical protein
MERAACVYRYIFPKIRACLAVRLHYDWVEERRNEMDKPSALPAHERASVRAILPAPDDPVAVLLVTEHWGRAIHTLLWIQRLFPGRFRSVVLVGVVKVQADALGTPDAIQCEHERLDASLDQLEVYCWKAGLGTSRAIGHGTDTVAELKRLVKDTVARHPGCVCFTNQLILPAGRRVGEWLYNQTALGLQRRLHLEGIPLVVLPITLR